MGTVLALNGDIFVEHCPKSEDYVYLGEISPCKTDYGRCTDRLVYVLERYTLQVYLGKTH
jgi:hypothetical protein